MPSFDLELLATHREQILLAEVAGWLHDMGKCSDEMVNEQATDKVAATPKFEYKTAFSKLLPVVSVALLGETCSLKELIEKGKPSVVNSASEKWLIRALGRCHAAAHIDKEEAEKSGRQPKADTRPSSAFGFEIAPLVGLTDKLNSLPLIPLSPRAELSAKLKETFGIAPGDTRRPENEVSLWDWSSIVAALFKAAVAGAVLGCKPEPKELRWRLLAVRVDRATFVAKSVKLADVLAREKVLHESYEKVRKLLEETYPLGTLFYQDADNGVFIVPDLPELLGACDGGATLHQQIENCFTETTQGEVLPEIILDAQGWQAQRPDRTSDTPPLGATLNRESNSYADIQSITTHWKDKNNTEPCAVCRLRPAAQDGVCQACADRRGLRIDTWQSNPASTIWMDELADDNGRVAMLVGKFGLDRWLSSEMISTLLVKNPGNNANYAPKNASPARMRRVWETCQQFWQTAQDALLPQIVGTHKRLALTVDGLHKLPHKTVLDGTLNGKPISVFRKCDTLLTISHIQQDGAKPGMLSVAWDGQRADLTVTAVQPANGNFASYTPLLPLLQSPDQFMSLLPAQHALDAATGLFEKYQTEFGKVRNRLPLFLGVVFFPRKTPLVAVMDAARRMLAQVPNDDAAWTVKTNANGKLSFDNGIEWQVPLKMGGGTTEDAWYPYFNTTNDPGSRTHRFNTPEGKHWVHAGCLKESDEVCIAPSRFAYSFLESASERYRVDVAKHGMLLEGLPELTILWEKLKQQPKLTDTELRKVFGLLQIKRTAWKDHPDEFAKFVEATLKQSSLRGAVCADDVTSGRFDHCLDLHLRVLKLRISHTTELQEKI